jgi:hypothetical protein
MQAYSESLKRNVVCRLLMTPVRARRRRRGRAAANAVVSARNQAGTPPPSTSARRPQEWSAQELFPSLSKLVDSPMSSSVSCFSRGLHGSTRRRARSGQNLRWKVAAPNPASSNATRIDLR